jgi:uncharacterized membrane protein
LRSVPASSLIFVVIVVLWAAYLVPSAIKKHRRTASARQADRDSQAMRVVVRRNSAPVGSALAAAAVNAAAVGASSRPVLGSSTPALPVAAQATTRVVPAVPLPRKASTVVSRRRRLLATVVGLVVLGWLTVIAGLAPWWSGAVPTLGLLFVVAALSRHGAASPARRVTVTPRAPEVTAVLPAVRVPAPTPTQSTVSTPRDVTTPSPLADDRGWDPVPVPLPTYLLKDKAPYVAPPLPAVAVLEDDQPTQVIDIRDHVRVVNE